MRDLVVCYSKGNKDVTMKVKPRRYQMDIDDVTLQRNLYPEDVYCRSNPKSEFDSHNCEVTDNQLPVTPVSNAINMKTHSRRAYKEGNEPLMITQEIKKLPTNSCSASRYVIVFISPDNT